MQRRPWRTNLAVPSGIRLSALFLGRWVSCQRLAYPAGRERLRRHRQCPPCHRPLQSPEAVAEAELAAAPGGTTGGTRSGGLSCTNPPCNPSSEGLTCTLRSVLQPSHDTHPRRAARPLPGLPVSLLGPFSRHQPLGANTRLASRAHRARPGPVPPKMADAPSPPSPKAGGGRRGAAPRPGRARQPPPRSR